jgi:hypothetical protein
MGGRQTLATLPILLNTLMGGGKPSLVMIARFLQLVQQVYELEQKFETLKVANGKLYLGSFVLAGSDLQRQYPLECNADVIDPGFTPGM